MKKFSTFLVLAFLLCNCIKAQPDDSIYVVIAGDTIHIWNTGAWENYGSAFRMDVSISNDTVSVTESDTSVVPANCNCYFDLCASVTGLQNGFYNVEVFRNIPLLDTTYYIGSTSFNYGGSSLNFSSFSYQSDCYSTLFIKENENLPIEFELGQNYPNPFNPTTKIRFTLTPSLSPGERVSEGPVRVTLKVYDVLGNEIATLADEEKPAGSYEVEFNAAGLPSGIYFYKLQAASGTGESFVSTNKMLLLK